MNIVIKEEFLSTVVGFGKSGLPLGSRDDLGDLAIIAQESQDPTLLNLFEKLPSLDALKKHKTDKQLKALSPAEDEEKPTEQEIINDAVPEPFNTSTKVKELNSKPPSPGK